MKKALVLLPMLALAMALLALVIATTGDNSRREASAAPDDTITNAVGRVPVVTECFLLAEGDIPNETVRLTTDNFGSDVVTVVNGLFMCEGARKQRIGATNLPPIGQPGRFVYECYRVEDGDDPADPFTLRTRNFGDHHVKVGRAIAMCEGAQKVHTHPDGTVTTIGSHRSVWECFQIEADATTDAEVVLTTSNFGVDAVHTGRPLLMCEEARKETTGTAGASGKHFGQATGIVWECFVLETSAARSERVSLTTNNFGKDDATVTSPFLMCERARKLTSIRFFPVTPAPTATPTPSGVPNPP